MSWGIDEVEGPIFPAHGDACRLNGDPAFALSGKKVGSRASQVNGARARQIMAFEKNRFSERCLSGIYAMLVDRGTNSTPCTNVRDERHIPDILWLGERRDDFLARSRHISREN